METKLSSDVLPYEFLKDIHRMERLRSVSTRRGPVTPQRRVCAFLTNSPVDFEGRTIHVQLQLSARVLQTGHLVQYNLTKPNGLPTSPTTLWKQYPPFRLAGCYPLQWIDLLNDVSEVEPRIGETRRWLSYRLLLVEIGASSH